MQNVIFSSRAFAASTVAECIEAFSSGQRRHSTHEFDLEVDRGGRIITIKSVIV